MHFGLLTKTTEVMNNINNKRIYIGPYEVAGYYSNLQRGFALLNIEADFIPFAAHRFGYDFTKKLPKIINATHYLKKKKEDSNIKIKKIVFSIIFEILTHIWAIHAIIKYDVFIFGFGRSLFRNNLDLLILKFLGKKVVMNIAHGADARPPYISGSTVLNTTDSEKRAKKLRILTKKKKNKIEFIEKYATHIIGSPCSSYYFLKNSFINTFMIGAPYSFNETGIPTPQRVDQLDSEKNSGSVTILHAPSDTNVKGTKVIKNIITKLKNDGYTIDFKYVNNKSNLIILNELKNCDFIVDQAYSDTPMSGFSSEAAWYGKPAVVGGYAKEYLEPLIASDMWPPSAYCLPEELEETIRRLIDDPNYKQKVGSSAYKFIRSSRHVKSVASKYVRIINDDIPNEWFLDPTTLNYLYGASQHKDKTRAKIKLLIDYFGEEALCINDKQRLIKEFLHFCDIENDRKNY